MVDEPLRVSVTPKPLTEMSHEEILQWATEQWELLEVDQVLDNELGLPANDNGVTAVDR